MLSHRLWIDSKQAYLLSIAPWNLSISSLELSYLLGYGSLVPWYIMLISMIRYHKLYLVLYNHDLLYSALAKSDALVNHIEVHIDLIYI